MTENLKPSVVGGVEVYGGDDWTRCRHYHQTVDIIAIRFVCCDRYYSCHLCHEELADHPAVPWPADRFGEAAVLCGSCGAGLTVNAYLAAQDCPECRAQFNPACKTHADLYFSIGG